MVNVAVVGLGKMGLSHLAIVNAHPDVDARARVRRVGATCSACWTSTPASTTYTDYDRMLREVELDAVIIATPSRISTRRWCARRSSAACTCSARSRSRSTPTTPTRCRALAGERGLVTQVGYHNRFVGAFREVKPLLDAGRDRRGHARPRRGLRPGRAQAQGRHLAQPQEPRAAAPLRLRRAPDRPRSTGTSASPIGRRRHRAQPHLLARDRRRGLQHALLPRRRDRADLGQLVRRVLSEDDHPDHRLGHRRAGSTPTARSARSTCARRRTPPDRLRARAGTSATRPS